MADPIPLLLKLQELYQDYGAVKITCCDQWKPPFCFKYTEKGITTRVQKIHKLKKGKVRSFSGMESILFFYFFKFNLGF